jgi:V/A-type H+-transporting ATPase subunit K
MKTSSSVRNKLAVWLIVAAVLLALPLTAVLWLPVAAGAEEGAALAPVMDSSIWRWGLVATALATGLSSLGAGFAVASVGSAAIGALAEKPDLFGRVIILVGLAEGIAIYGLIVSILILNRLV